MRIRSLFSSTAIHAGAVCGLGIWVGASLGEPPTPVATFTIQRPVEVYYVPETEFEAEPVEAEQVDEEVRIVDVPLPPVDASVFEAPAVSSAPTLTDESDPTRELFARVRPEPEPTVVEPEVEPVPAPPAAWVEAEALADSNPAPDYPREAIMMRQSGIVDVVVHIGADGVPTGVELERACRFPRLNRSVLTAVRKWRFTPARRNGVAVASTQVVGFEFDLQGGAAPRQVP